MKLVLAFFVTVMTAQAYAGTAEVLQAIADNANVGNGSADVTKKSFTPAEGSKLLKYWKGRWDNCTFSKPYASNKAAISAVREYGFDEETAKAIAKLEKSGKVAKIYGFETDHDIACSQLWVNVYTVDGYSLELWYGMGD